MITVKLQVNGQPVEKTVEERTLLAQLLREHLNLTGTHVGCDTTQCGCCVVHLDGRSVKSCTVLAAQANGGSVVTIEGLEQEGQLHPLQKAFSEHHALQCGFCTPGMIMRGVDILKQYDNPDRATIRQELEGNLCRCTGYENIVNAIASCAGKSPAATE